MPQAAPNPRTPSMMEKMEDATQIEVEFDGMKIRDRIRTDTTEDIIVYIRVPTFWKKRLEGFIRIISLLGNVGSLNILWII